MGRPETVDADTVFQIASMSKPIASTVVAALVGEGVVAWDDPIVRHEPAFAMHDAWVTRAITLRDMFCHRSGLPHHAGDLVEDIGYDRAEVLHRLRYVVPATSFRSHYAYTNFGLTAAAVAAARASGQSWEEVSAERLYRPLGMGDVPMENASAGMVGVNVGVPVPREPFSFGGWNESKFGVGDITGRGSIEFWTKSKKMTTKWNKEAGVNWMS